MKRTWWPWPPTLRHGRLKLRAGLIPINRRWALGRYPSDQDLTPEGLARAFFTLIAAFLTLAPAAAGAADIAAGKHLARSYCAQCHVVVDQGKSHRARVAGAPPDFSLIARDPGTNVEKLNAFLRFPHGQMNNVLLTRKEIDNLADYIESLR
ncbi:MAG: c-type cytochrome [Rhodospirillaceae bacterium]|nr:c-type cytochrome [Rhodospirillaceae bacterium]